MYFFNESFWFAICFFILIYFAYKPVKKAILNALDSKIADIKNQLLSAESLKSDAILLLQQAEQKFASIEELRNKMVKDARESSKIILEQQFIEIESLFEKRRSELANSLNSKREKAYHQLKIELIDEVKELVLEYFKTTKNSGLTDIEIVKLLNIDK